VGAKIEHLVALEREYQPGPPGEARPRHEQASSVASTPRLRNFPTFSSRVDEGCGCGTGTSSSRSEVFLT